MTNNSRFFYQKFIEKKKDESSDKGGFKFKKNKIFDARKIV